MPLMGWLLACRIFPISAFIPHTAYIHLMLVSHLDKKCSEIDELITVKQAKIEKLEQYKRSLIYEYVTGKKEVS